MKSKLHRCGAFTLIEILVAMAIFGLVLAAIYATWSLILKGSQTGLTAAAEVQRQRIAIQTIETTLSSVRSFAADLDHYSFILENGNPSSLMFTARLPKSFPRSGKFGDFDVRRVQFSIESTSDGERSLVLRQWPILMDIDEDELNYPLVLARNVQNFLVEPWDAEAGDWSDVWEQTNAIPPLVRVTLSFGGNNSSYTTHSQPVEYFSRVMALPSVTVPATWQTPSMQQGGQGGRGGQGLQPGRGGQGGQGLQPGRGGQGQGGQGGRGGGQNNPNNPGGGRVRML